METPQPGFPSQIKRYLDRLYDPRHRAWACRATNPAEVVEWQAQARPVLRSLLGLDRIREESAGHTPAVTCGEATDCGAFTRRKCVMETEPEVNVPFWLLEPKPPGKRPLAILPHGHDGAGPDTHAGLPRDEEHALKIRTEDRDVAVQAACNGFVAIAPATRGLAEGFVGDAFRRHGKACTSHQLHGLLAGRPSMGERVWDMERLIDWAAGRDNVDARQVLMMGNSGGGVATVWAAACDTRIGIAVSSCAYSSFVGLNGKIQHHMCNMVPGVLRFGEFWDVAGLIAPRHFLAVHGRKDRMKATDEVDRAARECHRIYEAAGAADRFAQKYGPEGHRFYKALMWPFIRAAQGK